MFWMWTFMVLLNVVMLNLVGALVLFLILRTSCQLRSARSWPSFWMSTARFGGRLARVRRRPHLGTSRNVRRLKSGMHLTTLLSRWLTLWRMLLQLWYRRVWVKSATLLQAF